MACSAVICVAWLAAVAAPVGRGNVVAEMGSGFGTDVPPPPPPPEATTANPDPGIKLTVEVVDWSMQEIFVVPTSGKMKLPPDADRYSPLLVAVGPGAQNTASVPTFCTSTDCVPAGMVVDWLAVVDDSAGTENPEGVNGAS